MPKTTTGKDQRAAVTASFLGWTLDAFDFFLVVFCLTAIGHEFGKTDAEVALSITVTLAFRPVGAFLFGLLADRYGRRLPLMLDLVFYSVIEVLTGLAPNYSVFFTAARSLRYRHGRRVGRGRKSRYGKGACPASRRSVRVSAAGLRARLPAGGGRVFLCFSSAGAGGRCFSWAACPLF